MTLTQKIRNIALIGSLGLGGILSAHNAASADYAGKATAQSRIIDIQPADNSNERTQSDWISFFNKQGKAMIDASEVYKVGKTVKLVESLRADLKNARLVTSTRIIYDYDTYYNSPYAKIVHNYGSTVVKPTETNVVVPVYEENKLSKVLGTPEGLAYLRVLFDTNDDAENIAKTLQRLSGNCAYDPFISTLPNFARIIFHKAPVGFECNERGFNVSGDMFDDNTGHSRGVSIMTDKVK